MATILYFGKLQDLTGTPQEAVALPNTVTNTAQLRTFLDNKFAAKGALCEPSVRIAVNGQISPEPDRISDSDEIAFLPPVGGG